MTECLDYNVMVNTVVHADNRALCLLIAKSKVNGGWRFECFTKLQDALVVSIITYGAAIWGFKNNDCINNVPNCACIYLLTVAMARVISFNVNFLLSHM